MATDTDADADHRLDVREIDGPPFDDITAALGSLADGERLELIAPFEPKPLYEVLSARGYGYEVERDGDVWRVCIERA